MDGPDEAAVPSLIQRRDTVPDALQPLSPAPALLPPPLRPVTPRPADLNAKADLVLRWYARRKGLIGTAQV